MMKYDIVIVNKIQFQLMTEAQVSQKKKSNHFNDNCQNCIKQRKQNQSFIKIYQKLQQISSKTSTVRQKVQQHQLCSDTNRSFYKNYQEKIVQLPKNKKEVNIQLLQNVGFELAAGILQRQNKKKVVEENQRLKQMITQMRNQKWQSKQQDSLDLMKSSCFTEKKSFSPLSTSMDKAYNSCQTPKKGQLSETQNLQNLLLSNQSEQNFQQNTTQSSSFKPKGSLDLNKYTDLNLWLYQSQKNAKLQEQLYVPQRSKNKSFVSKMATRGMSSLRKK